MRTKKLQITKGNWEFFTSGHWCEVGIKEPIKSICAINTSIEEHMQNAKLISNAPMLYEALQDLVRFCEENKVGAELEIAKEVLLKCL